MNELNSYEKEKANKSSRIKIGKEIPSGGVNMAYVHTPDLKVDEAISLVDTSYVSDNIIPSDQIETIAMANEQGELEYVNYVDRLNITPRDPGTTFPNERVVVTNQFFENTILTQTAFYYCDIIKYHYDNKTATPNEDGEYELEPYTGNQIQVTDEFGNALPDTDMTAIYVKAEKDNPNIYTVYVYVHQNTDEYHTYKVRYNHIDEVTTDDLITSVQNTVEIYANTSNSRTIQREVVDEVTGDKVMKDFTQYFLETGKLRVVNGDGVFSQATAIDVTNERLKDNPKTIYSIEEHENGKGYKITVPAKTEYDSRPKKEFAYVIEATYKDKNTGEMITLSSGVINDTLMHPESLLQEELNEYTSEMKRVGIPQGNSVMDARSVINYSLPYGTPSIPQNASFKIHDLKNEITYYQHDFSADNEEIVSKISESNYAEAKAKTIEIKKWPIAQKATTALQESSFDGSFSIIPERQKVRWPFEFTIDGVGAVEKKSSINLKWNVCADVGFEKFKEMKVLDMHKYTKWQAIGKTKSGESSKGQWVYEWNDEAKRICLQFLDYNSHDMVGLYQIAEHYDQSLDVSHMMGEYSPYEDKVKFNVDPSKEKDYIFTTKVRMMATDDDVIGVMFRVQGEKYFYLFVWERDERTYTGQASETSSGGTEEDEGDYEDLSGSLYGNETEEGEDEGELEELEMPDDYEEGSGDSGELEDDFYGDSGDDFGDEFGGGEDDSGENFPDESDAIDEYSYATELKSNDTSSGGTTVPKDYGNGYRFIFDARGAAHVYYHPDGSTEDEFNTSNKARYTEDMGLGTHHKRIFKVTPATTSERLPKDLTGCSFEDITDKTDLYDTPAGKSGWIQNVDYKITIETIGDQFKVYIDSNTGEGNSKGVLCCKATDDTYTQGSYGIVSLSQPKTIWWDLKLMPIENKIICSPDRTTLITTEDKIKLSNYSVSNFMSKYIETYRDTHYKGCNYNIRKYYGSESEYGKISIDADKFHYIWFTPNQETIKSVRTMWRTEEQGLTIKGKGVVAFRADGTFDIDYSPKKITTKIPDSVLDFAWSTPKVLLGSNINVALIQQERIEVTAKVPPIEAIGTALTIKDFNVKKSDGLKQAYNMDLETLYEVFNIPEYVPMNELLFRIERGEYNVDRKDPKEPETLNPNYKINFRFRVLKDGNMHLPVDQFKDWLGVNRLRMDQVVGSDGKILEGTEIDVVGWTHHQYFKAIPLYAVKSLDERRIQLEKPRVEPSKATSRSWYMRVKNGHFTRRLQLPYYEKEEDTVESNNKPAIYLRYPMLDGMVTSEDQIVEVDAEYAIPEYGKQEFYNDKYILIDKEEPVIVNSKCIQVMQRNIVLVDDHEKEYNRIWVVRNNKEKEMRIADVDRAKGIFYLLDEIIEGDHVFARYVYNEDYYTYKGFLRENVKYEPVESKLDVNIEFSASLKMSIDYIPEKLEVTNNDIPNPWCINGTKTKITTPTGTVYIVAKGNADENSTHLTKTIEMMKQYVENVVFINPAMLNKINFNYGTDLLFLAKFYYYTDATVSAARNLLNNGASAIIAGEYTGMTSWIKIFKQIMTDYNIEIINTSDDTSPNNFIENEDIPGLSDSAVSVIACGVLDISNSQFKPLLQTKNGETLIATYRNDKQLIVATGDSNMFEDQYVLDVGLNNFFNAVMMRMVSLKPEPIKITIKNDRTVKRLRIFINKDYNTQGINAYSKDVNIPSGTNIIDIANLIIEANKSSQTGSYVETEGYSNTIIVEAMSETGTLDYTTIILNQGDCGVIEEPTEPETPEEPTEPEEPETPDDSEEPKESDGEEDGSNNDDDNNEPETPEEPEEPEETYPIIFTDEDIPGVWCPNTLKVNNSRNYERLVVAYRGGLNDDVEGAITILENIIQSNGLTIENKYIGGFDILYAEDLDVEKDFLLVTDMKSGLESYTIGTIQNFLKAGGSALLISERAELPNWIKDFDLMVKDYKVKTIPGEYVFTDGHFSPTHPLTENISNLPFEVANASTFNLTGSNFKPFAFAPDGGVIGADYTNGQQHIIILGDSNFIIDETLSKDENSGNHKLIENILQATVMVKSYEDITIETSCKTVIDRMRIFINKPYNEDGTGSYEVAVNYTAGENVMNLTQRIKDAIASNKTGSYVGMVNAVNTIIIELHNDKGIVNYTTFTIKGDGCQ